MTARPDWAEQPPYASPAGELVAKHRARCFCGAVQYEVAADPVAAKLCHCRGCQSLHGAPFQWAVIFHKQDVRFVRGTESLYFYHSEAGQPGRILPCKLSCCRCRSPIADEGRRMFLAFGPLFDFGFPPRVPPSFQPTCHIFYGARVMDIPDDLPKYLGHQDQSPRWLPSEQHQ